MNDTSKTQRDLYEAAVIERLKESGFLEIEIRTESLLRCGEGYQDEVINAGWHYWNAALSAAEPQPAPSVAVKAQQAVWIKHDGKNMPVNAETIVEVRMASGFEHEADLAGNWLEREGSKSNWHHDLGCPHPCDIVAYHIVPNSPALSAQVHNASENMATQIEMGHGKVDVSRIEHEGRSGILFRPRSSFIPVGHEGELPAGEYWPVSGDVVIWIASEGGAQVIEKYLKDFLPDRSAQVQDVARTVEAFDKDHPELYWHIAKGKITAGEPLYGAIITDMAGNELGHGESDVNAVDAFKIAGAKASFPSAPEKQDIAALETQLKHLITTRPNKAALAAFDDDTRMWFVAQLTGNASGRVPLTEIEAMVARHLPPASDCPHPN